jgi:hypothetical protein
LLLLTGSVVISFFATEIFLRVVRLGYNNSPLTPSDTLHHKHPSNFSFIAYSPQGEWDGFAIKTNQFGDRVEDSCKSKIKSGQTILLGDSFIEGYQVQDPDTIAGKLQSLTCSQGVKVQNLGVSSYSPLLSYAQLYHRIHNKEIVLDSTKENTIIHFLYDNDIQADRMYEVSLVESTPCPIIGATETLSPIQIASRHSYTLRLLRRFQLTLEALSKSDRSVGSDIARAKRFSPNNNCQKSNEDLASTSKYIESLKDLSHSIGANYLVSAIPADSRKARSTNYSCFRRIADLAGVEFIDAPSELFSNPERYYFEKDIHLNSKGSILFAEEVFKNVRFNKSKTPAKLLSNDVDTGRG